MQRQAAAVRGLAGRQRLHIAGRQGQPVQRVLHRRQRVIAVGELQAQQALRTALNAVLRQRDRDGTLCLQRRGPVEARMGTVL